MTRPDNWGRWGADDERGAVNHLTPERLVAAARLVREGRAFALGMPVDARAPRLVGRPPVQHYMAIDGADYEAGARPPHGRGLADDVLIVAPHGTTTHIDALSHVWADGVLYNGHPQATVRSYGARRCGIEKVESIVTRGVLLDLPRQLGSERLDADLEVTAALLESSAERAGVTVQPGDAVLFRTGWSTLFDADRDAYDAAQPGLAGDACRWLAERDVCLVGSDNSAIGPLVGAGGFHVAPEDDAHLVLLWRHGIYLVEMLWLEQLAEAGATEFLLVTAPLRITGGTASPVNPVAVL